MSTCTRFWATLEARDWTAFGAYVTDDVDAARRLLLRLMDRGIARTLAALSDTPHA